MGSLNSARKRLVGVLALCGVVIGGLVTLASAAGPGGWDHLGEGATPGSDALNLSASALEVTPGALYVGGKFTNAGGIDNADRIATWNGSTWSAVSSSTGADHERRGLRHRRLRRQGLCRWHVHERGRQRRRQPRGLERHELGAVLHPPRQIDRERQGPAGHRITLYVGGDFQDGGGVLSADYLLACDLSSSSGTPSDTVVDTNHPFSGPVKALTATSDGTLYAGGRFGNLENIPAADNVAFMDGDGWHPMGTGAGPCTCALDAYVRGLATNGTDVFVGTEGSNVDGIAQADHVVNWDGSEWSAMGSNSSGADGWFPAGTNIHDLAGDGSNLFATGTFVNANGNPLADNIAWFDGTSWRPVGSNGAGNGPWLGEGAALAIVDRRLYAAGNFTSAGGDSQAGSVASFALSQIIAVATPTVTAGPSAVPTPTVTADATTAGSDIAAPRTSLRRARIDQARHRATFRFASSEQGSTFACKLDRERFKRCTSPKTYKKLGPGKHVFRVKARDRVGNVDATPTVKRFRIKRR